MKYHCCSVNLNSIVIPECLCRESSGFAAFKVARSPTQAFGDDDFVAFCFHVSSELLRINNLIVQAITDFQRKLTGH